MKSFLSSLSLSASIVVMAVCLFQGFRMGPCLVRGLIVYMLTYAGGLVVALVFFMAYLRPESAFHSSAFTLPAKKSSSKEKTKAE